MASNDGKADGGRGGNRRRSAWFVACFVAALAMGVLLLARADWRAQHDPQFCAAACHHEARGTTPGGFSHIEGWVAAGHAGIECQSCHPVTLRSGLALYAEAFAKRQATPRAVAPHGGGEGATCAGCHEKRPAEWRVIAETQGHRAHRGLKGVDCLSCHGPSTHAAVPLETTCLRCHKDETLHKASTAGAETCLSCHSFAASPKNAAVPTPIACARCHADRAALLASVPASPGSGGEPVRPMRDVNDHALHGGVACQLCHNAHGKKMKAPEGQPVCAGCHRLEDAQTKAEDRKGPEEHRKCVGCHKPHAPRETALQTCVDCHQKNAKGLTALGPEKTTALKHKSCASCHLPHTWRAERSGCAHCHEEEGALVLTRSPAQHSDCTTCHDVHGPPPSGAVCLKCHANESGKQNHVALAPERHKDCTSCHNPHAPRPEETRTACAKCHASESTQVLATGPEGHAKTSCFGCHQPHENPRPAPDVCAKCHADRAKAVGAAAPPKHRVCTSCHQKHEFRIAEIAPACATCHRPLYTTASGEPVAPTHKGACKNCHTFHGSPGIAKSACFACHRGVEAAFHPPNEKHAVCRSCHEPHTPASTAPGRCVTCHQHQAAVAREWPPASPHAQACNACHQPHDVRIKKPCADCHAKESALAAGGKHACTQCHAPHQEPPGTGAAWWARCSQCHADKVESAKERGPTHSDCKSCHQAHRFGVPTCASCHQDVGSKGLHAVAEHAANCASCHEPHVKSDPKPAQCLACHTDRRTHEPDAKRCQACHLFK